MNEPHGWQWIEGYRNGTLSEQEFTDFQEALRSDVELRELLRRQMSIDSAIREVASTDVQLAEAWQDAGDQQAIERSATFKRAFVRTAWATPLSWTVAAVVIMITVRLLWPTNDDAESRLASEKDGEKKVDTRLTDESASDRIENLEANGEETTAQGVAIMTRLINVAWEEGEPKWDRGDSINPGVLRLREGLAQIEFFCGATVVVEGPATLELVSAWSARCLKGKFRAQVPPPAHGFELRTKDFDVIDLGTEFALSVSDEGASVQVFDGEIELHRGGMEPKLLSAGEAVEKGADGTLQVAPLAPNGFVGIEHLETQSKEQAAKHFARWSKHNEQLRHDSRLLVHYDFYQTFRGQRTLRNQATNTAQFANAAASNANLQADTVSASERDGAIVGATQVPGRWPGKEALEFKQPGDRVRVHIGGEHGSLTLATWVKIDSLDRWYNSLFLTDNYQQGEPHWQILNDGRLFFSVRIQPEGAQGRAHFVYFSNVFWEPSMSGKWLHLATVYDTSGMKVTHYLNGEVLSQIPIAPDSLVEQTRIGSASIGNWSLPTKADERFAIRNLNGRMDEFSLYGAALNGKEILEIYRAGKP